MKGMVTPSRRYLRSAVFFGVIPLLIFVALYDSNIHGPVDLFHEGESLAPASETLYGKLPFRDIYLQHGWGANLLRTKLAFRLFGASVASNRKFKYDVSGYLVPLAWIGVYLLLYSLFRKKIWIVPAFALLAFADVLINDRHLLPFLSISLLAAGTKDARFASFLAGTFAAAAAFYSLDTGAYALAIGVAFIFLYSTGNQACSKASFRGAIISYLAGWLAGALPLMAYMASHGILDDFFANCYLQLRYQTETWGIPVPSIASLFGPFENTTARNRAIYLVIKWYYPMLIYACMCVVLLPGLALRKLGEYDGPLLLTTLAGIIFFRSAVGRADEGHLMYAVALFWILNICFLERAFLHVREKRSQQPDRMPPWLDGFQRLCFNYLSIGVIVLGLVLYFWATCRNGGIAIRKTRLSKWKKAHLASHVPLAIERSGGIRVPPKQAAEIQETVAFITAHTQPDEPIFDFSNQGAYYFLSNRTNPTSYCQAVYATPTRLQMEVLEQLKSSAPSLVLLRENEPHRPI
ncbi:MAG: hypothetical protein JSV16_11850, partial [Candidatus Hydrogenedentota bacterium]